MRWRRLKSLILPLGGLALLLVGLFVSLGLKDKIITLFSEATGQKAEIIVDAASDLGSLPQPWRNFAQGGEEPGAIVKVADKIKPLRADYIRLDHIFDYYEVVKKENNQLQFNWTRLDAEVNAILGAGAKPLLALSYLPSGLGQDITAAPDNWDDWFTLVKATVEHYSGRQAKNIADVYYEVWNEPDLFGSWKTSGDKNYLQLYRVSAQAADAAINTQTFKLGGPATTGAYPNWIEALLNLVDRENLRLDFVSWHRYSWESGAISADVDLINRLLEPHPRLALKEKLVTEWGPDPQNNPAYDNKLGASHLLVTVRDMLGKVHKAFNFEVMDGQDPAGQAFWGRYGLLTHHSAGAQAKPRYNLLLWLNQLQGQRLGLKGEGSWVKAIAVVNDNVIQVYLVNYDPRGNHQETVPLVISNLTPGSYQVKAEWFEGKTQTKTIQITSGTFADQVVLKANEIVRLSLTH
ncbi:MAG: hypothetical protein U1C50_00700 [Patescibacteria group bacterium]|nr:hypothetical protein [Candidatus Beckwithbacteria bacterium]MDZ4228755.1 hypothetical protein [Patescibacteria group bacterium]